MATELRCLNESFEIQAKKTPENIAIVSDDGRKLTYKELENATSILATNLRHKGCGKEIPVGIYMGRGMEFSIVYIAALRAGGGYLPIELAYPEPLLLSVIEDSQPCAVVTLPEHKDRLPSTVTVICLDEGWQKRLKEENEKCEPLPPLKVDLDDLAYIIYSSGTTGQPKGIMCPHRGSAFSYGWRHTHYPYQPDDRVASNVFYTWEMFRPLMKGITMYPIPDNVIYDPPCLLRFLKENKITRVLFTPSLLEAVLDTPDIDIASHLCSMRQVWLCGEVVTMALRDRFVTLLPGVKLVNLYSISECHDVAVADLSAGELEKQAKLTGNQPGKFCPVGKIFDGVHVVIFDENMKMLPIGMPGEIYVGGPTIAKGYLKKPELTKSKFIQRPAEVSEKAGERLYRTGDWGYMLSSGELEICGRCDSMVKVRGYSIELQAVESALLDLPIVNACTVMAHGEEGTDKHLVAYVVPDDGVTKKDIRAALKARLPFHMIPSYFVLLESVPVASSGKLDKKILPKFDKTKEEERSIEDATTQTEKSLSEIWKKILNLKAIDTQENFFDLGGHSMLAARMLAQVRVELGVEISMTELFKHNTIVALSNEIDRRTGKAKDEGQVISDHLDLLQEAEYHDQSFVNMDMMLRAFWRSCEHEHRWQYGRVLLTGATGYLGAFLVRDLLLLTKVHLYCLVRELPDTQMENRLKKNLQDYGILAKDDEEPTDEQRHLKLEFTRRLTAVKGDVSLINFGLSKDDYSYFSYEIDFVIHAAAAVNLIYPYKALHGPNVLGTQNVLMFACTSKIKPVHYVSTDAVFPHGVKDCSEEDDMTKHYKELTDGYSQTKWVAEQLVMKAGKRGLPVAIYRLGNLSGESANAFWNPADFNFLMLLGCLATGHAANVEWLVEMTPVDFVSTAIVKLTQGKIIGLGFGFSLYTLQRSVGLALRVLLRFYREFLRGQMAESSGALILVISWSLGKVFHIINCQPIDSKHLLEWISTHGYPLSIVPYKDWESKVRQVASSRKDKSLNLLVQLLDTMVRDETFFAKLSTYKNSNFLKAIDFLGLSYPAIDGTLLKSYMTGLVSQGIIPKPKVITQGKGTLTGRVAVVTGASSGIGAAIAKKLAQSGAAVAVAARRLDRLENIRNSIVQNGDVAIAFKTDVVNREQMVELVRQTEDTLGPVDIIVNCAGVMYYTLMKNMHVDEWERTVDVNCKGVLNGISAVLPGMLERGRGHIVSISSDAGRKVFPGLSVYSASKFFVEAISQGLRLETANSGIKVTTIQPGDVQTELLQHTTDQEAKDMYDGSACTKILEPEDIANAVLFTVTQPEYCSVNEILVEPRGAPA